MKQCKYNNELTVIIPFLNEGEEVYNTVKKLRENSINDFNIILINDASYDGYNYQSVAQQFNAVYIEHNERKGVAFSRDEGIDICSTEYFLLLDAHMRVFQNNWVTIILKELQDDHRALFCCKTLALDEKGALFEKATHMEGYGAYFDFNDLSANWITSNFENDITYIPCILGASYACNKNYWKYLHGIEGLKSYGKDEEFISIKAWLEGGSCKLLQNVIFGHIFRRSEQVPYEGRVSDFVYNHLLIIELLGGNFQESIGFMRTIKKKYSKEVFNNALEQFLVEKKAIIDEKVYLEKIFNRNINFLHDFNENYKEKK
jgi:glycosyltransferase involved in cell wall biosynthesis